MDTSCSSLQCRSQWPAPTADPAWLLVEEDFNLAREHEIESLFAIGNGYVGTRGSLPESTPLSAPATFIAGVFDIDPRGSVPELAIAPDWMHHRSFIADETVPIDAGGVLAQRRILDMAQGILWREWRVQDAAGRVTRLRSARLASLADVHVLLSSLELRPENYAGTLRFETTIGPAAGHRGRLALGAVIDPVAVEQRGAVRLLELQTSQGVRIAFAATNRAAVKSDGSFTPLGLEDIALPWRIAVELGRTYRVDRTVTVYTSRDVADPSRSALEHAQRLTDCTEAELIEAHIAAWNQRWLCADVRIEGDAEAQRALRFGAYHLISAARWEDHRVSVGARALTGAAYKGHVFWDTDIYMLPFYTYTHPSSARALLLYRHHTLPAARKKAAAYGYRGALYAWESTDTGEETAPSYALTPNGEVLRIRSGEQEHHISADVAYAAWHYWRASGDDAFFRDAGAEIVLETARFWASRGEFGDDGRYHIRTVIGPDEYHEGVDDSAYTNWLAQWNLERAIDTAGWLARRSPDHWRALAQRIELSDREIESWRNIAQRMYLGLNEETGLVEEFAGYFAREPVDLDALPVRNGALDLLLGHERVARTQIVKQADVVLLIYLLWDRFTPAQRRANFRYYAARTAHGSSLSPAIYALVAARLGETQAAKEYFQQAAQIDLANNMGNAAGGVHAAALGGLWQAAIFGFAGLHGGSDHLTLDPRLDPGWQAMDFPLAWRGRQLRVHIGVDRVTVTLEHGPPASVIVGAARRRQLETGVRIEWERQGSDWKEVINDDRSAHARA